MRKLLNDNKAGLAGILVFSVFIFLPLFTNGTADEGDSITRYLISRYTLGYPYQFFHHWSNVGIASF